MQVVPQNVERLVEAVELGRNLFGTTPHG